MKIIFHCNELDKLQQLQSNVRNIVAFQDVISVDILLNADAVLAVQTEYSESESIVNLESTYKIPIRIHVCENSLNARGISLNGIHSKFILVPSGVYHIAQQQTKGYLYIKV